MKKKRFVHYLIDALKMLRKNGLSTLSDPISAFQAYAKQIAYENDRFLIKSLDYSMDDLVKNREIMERFRNMGGIQVETINWFIPYFERAYGGIHTILRFADYFHTEKSVKNTFVIYGNPLASQNMIIDNISSIFPNLQTDRIVILRNHDLTSVPQADICIATLWTSAYLVLKFNRTKGKFYLIQDYEPLAYPAGTFYALAEATYRFGFHGIVNTPGLHEIFVRDYKSNAVHFTPPVETSIFYPSERAFSKPSVENPFTIFFYARPDRKHNAFELGIAALQEIKRKYGERIRIYTAGTRWNPRNYDSEKTFIDLGTLPYRETASLYRNCDLGIAFSLSRHPSYIPFELMACGCPVLTNYNSSTTWFLKDGFNCLISEPSVSCICEKVEMLMNNPDLRRKLVSNAFGSMPKTCWEDETEKIYRFICTPNHPKQSK
jgi:glycosyltransferase involved in cell wall biosynthesis